MLRFVLFTIFCLPAAIASADPLFFPINNPYFGPPSGGYCQHLNAPTVVSAQAMKEAERQMSLIYQVRSETGKRLGEQYPARVLTDTEERRLIAGYVLLHWFAKWKAVDDFHHAYSIRFWHQKYNDVDMELLWHILQRPCRAGS